MTNDDEFANYEDIKELPVVSYSSKVLLTNKGLYLELTIACDDTDNNLIVFLNCSQRKILLTDNYYSSILYPYTRILNHAIYGRWKVSKLIAELNSSEMLKFTIVRGI